MRYVENLKDLIGMECTYYPDGYELENGVKGKIVNIESFIDNFPHPFYVKVYLKPLEECSEENFEDMQQGVYIDECLF